MESSKKRKTAKSKALKTRQSKKKTKKHKGAAATKSLLAKLSVFNKARLSTSTSEGPRVVISVRSMSLSLDQTKSTPEKSPGISKTKSLTKSIGTKSTEEKTSAVGVADVSKTSSTITSRSEKDAGAAPEKRPKKRRYSKPLPALATGSTAGTTFSGIPFLPKTTRWRKLFIIATVLGLIFLMSIAWTIVAFAFFVFPTELSEITFSLHTKISKTLPPPPTTGTISGRYGVVPLSQQCRTKFGNCFYHKDKYITDCTRTPCSNVYTIGEAVFQHYHIVWQMRLRFRIEPMNDSGHSIFPFTGSPCRNGNERGICVNQTCDTTPNPTLDRYEQMGAVDGGWEGLTYENAECLLLSDFLQNKFPVVFTTRCSPGNLCNPYAVEFRTCTNPMPDRGGKPCFEPLLGSFAEIPWWSLPVKMQTRCPQCNNLPNYDNMDCSINKKTQCGYLYYLETYRFFDDFYRCCPDMNGKPSSISVGRNLCVGGMCVPITPL